MQRTAYTARLWIVTFIVKINPCESHKTDAKCIAEQWDEWISDVDKADNLLVSEVNRIYTMFLALTHTHGWDIAAAMFMDPKITLETDTWETELAEFLIEYIQPFGTVLVSTTTWGKPWAKYHFFQTGESHIECDIISKEGGSLIVTYKGEPDKITVTSDDLTKWGVVTNLHLDHPRMWRSIDKRSYFAPAVAFFATKCASRKV